MTGGAFVPPAGSPKTSGCGPPTVAAGGVAVAPDVPVGKAFTPTSGGGGPPVAFGVGRGNVRVRAGVRLVFIVGTGSAGRLVLVVGTRGVKGTATGLAGSGADVAASCASA